MNFNICNYLNGEKDYIITYINGESYYWSQIKKIFSLNGLVNQVLENNYSKNTKLTDRVIHQVYGFNIIQKDIIFLTDAEFILRTNDIFDVKCYMNHDYNSEIFKSNKDLVVYGLLSNIDFQHKIIIFKNCFLKTGVQ